MPFPLQCKRNPHMPCCLHQLDIVLCKGRARGICEGAVGHSIAPKMTLNATYNGCAGISVPGQYTELPFPPFP